MVEKIKLNFLGTGSAIPTARRNHPAVLLRYKAESVLIDCGEGTQRQFRKAHLNPCKITKILISHWHGDHVLGLPGLLQTMMLNGYNKKLEIYGPKGTSAKVRQFFDLLGRKGQDLDVKVKEVSRGKIVDEGDFYIEVAEMDHDAPAVAYSFVVKEKMRLDKAKLKKMKVPNSPLVGELVKGKTVEIGGKKINGKKLMYKEDARKVVVVMDTRYNEGAVKLAKGADLLISEATYSKEEQEIADEYGHLSSVGAAKIAKKAKVKGLVLMHLSQRYEAIPKVILKEAKEVFKDVIIPEDLDEVEL
ncbi:ribonuclease Z [archaeon]|jgi:ribonuclease Z|nr:ribonuclease Z [archaeon]